ncbi:hypothetical protein M758_2G153700 [Ceratodon purpureus]|nr:hypothetical protein M758_2G153700 [Ceratodon purpureus]
MKVCTMHYPCIGCIVGRESTSSLELVLSMQKFPLAVRSSSFCRGKSLKSTVHWYLQDSPVWLTPFPGLRKVLPSPALTSATTKAGEVFTDSRADTTSISYEDNDEILSFGVNKEVDNGNNVEIETLNLLEWPKVCVQVSEFASTLMAIALALEGSLPIGRTVAESEELQAQTAAAGLLPSPLDFSDIVDLRNFIEDAQSGNVCQLDDLCQVRKTLAAVRRLHSQVLDLTNIAGKDGQGAGSTNPLETIMLNCNLCSDLEATIDHCLDCSRSTVLDRASPKLASIRLKRQENSKALEALIKETAAMVFNAGGMDAQLVTKRRGRMCVAVRASQKGLLKGGVTLDVSNSGATYFMEPEAAIQFNNEEIQLAEEEKSEEIAVLRQLTFMLLDVRTDVVDLLEKVIILDFACARAGHSAWLNAARPTFLNDTTASVSSSDSLSDLLVDIKGVRHPLLLGSALPSPINAHRYGTLRQKAKARSSSSRVKDVETPASDRLLPVPIDIDIRRGVKVVTITGPNTGGKTAALKTLGIVALMAKAGLCLPATGIPRLPWFDSILADIGDDQSLERSLSTFSGHIRRVRQILEAGTAQSLILLDEIGGGTDPSEGAALATAILRSLATSVQLTLATTHCAELRTLKDQDPEFENASVEFDVKTLRPTYRVLWGIAGQSNALNIAASLGFDSEVLSRARELVTKLVPASLGARSTELMVPLLKQRDEQRERSEAAASALAFVSKVHNELKSESQNLPQKEAKLRLSQEESANEDVAEANARLEEILLRFQESTEQKGKDVEGFSMRDAQAAIAAIVEDYASKPVASITSASANSVELDGKVGDGNMLRVGEQVIIKRLGKLPATIVEIPQAENDYLTVQAGTMKMRVKLNEIVSRVTSTEKEGSRKPLVQQAKQPGKSRKLKRPEPETEEEIKYDVAVQTSKNTLDLRGKRVEESLQELDLALASRAPQSVLFIVHGMGTGAVKEAVWQVLKKHPYVAKFEQESVMNPGCTIVYIK